MKANWDAVVGKMNNPIVIDRFVRLSLCHFTSHDDVADVDAFFKDKDTSSFNRTLEQTKDKSRARATYKERDAGAIKEWLAANNYL